MNSNATPDRTERIRALNDAFRTRFAGGRVMLTAGVDALPSNTKAAVIKAVRTFDAFNEDNDPHGEHDFGKIEIDGEAYFFKIDYYDAELRYGSEDPSNPAVTTRVLTIMRADEY